MKIMSLALVLIDYFDLSQAGQSGFVPGTITYKGEYGGYTIHVNSIDGKIRYRLAHCSSQVINPLLAIIYWRAGHASIDKAHGWHSIRWTGKRQAGHHVLAVFFSHRERL